MSELKKIEDALSKHLAGGLYFAATDSQKRSAVAMAERDILSQTGRNVDQNDPVFTDAVAEQTVFLLLNLDKLHSPLNDIASESIEGAGSITYRRDSKPARLMSVRAMQLCAMLERKTVELARG